MGRVRDVLALVAAIVVLTGGGSGLARAQNLVGAPNGSQFFRIEAESARGRSGRPLVRGYVYNLSPYEVANVRLGVEGLDASGATTGASTAGWVNGEIPSNDRRYFEMPIAQPATTFRVTVLSYDIRTLDGGNVQ